jgi:hypothetical protein
MIHVKTLKSVHGHDVDVSHKIIKTRDNLHVIELCAVCGSSTEMSRVTIGSVDGSRHVPPSKEELQTILNMERQRVADEASWKETIAENITGID